MTAEVPIEAGALAAIGLSAATNPPPPIATSTVPNPPEAFASIKGWNT